MTEVRKQKIVVIEDGQCILVNILKVVWNVKEKFLGFQNIS